MSHAAAAAALALRVFGVDAPAAFSFSAQPPVCADSGPCATLRAGKAPNTIEIAGTTAVEMSYALAHYSRTLLNASFSWNATGGNQVRLPPTLPPLRAPLTLQKRCARSQPRCYSYYANVCTLTYSMWAWDWARWEQEIDWMALSGVNLVLAYTGREYVYRKVYRALGLNQSFPTSPSARPRRSARSSWRSTPEEGGRAALNS